METGPNSTILSTTKLRDFEVFTAMKIHVVIIWSWNSGCPRK